MTVSSRPSEEPESSASSVDISKELTELRGHSGMTILRIKELAPRLQELPVTKDECRRLDLPAEYPTGAYRAVVCTIDNRIGRTDLKRVLRRTLNIDGENSNLEDRRRSLMAELYMGKRAYVRLEDEAYVQLSGMLVSTRTSPCTDTERPADAPFIVDVVKRVMRFRSQTELARALVLLTVEPNRRDQEELAQAILRLLPNLSSELAASGSDDAGGQHSALESVANGMSAALTLKLAGFNDGHRFTRIMVRTYLEDLFGDIREVHNGDTYMALKVAWRTGEQDYLQRRGVPDLPMEEVQLLKGRDIFPSPRYYAEKRQVFTVVAADLLSVDRNQRWREVLPAVMDEWIKTTPVY